MNVALSELHAGLSVSDGGPQVSPQTQRCAPACPRCQASVLRVRRRLLDRLISAVYPVHRYRCHSIICHWEGNLPYKATVLDPRDAVGDVSPNRAPANTVAPDRASEIA